MNEVSRRFALRERTSSIHTALDRQVGPFHDRDAYIRYLRGIAVFRLGMEAPLRTVHWPREWQGWRPRTVGDLIALDLADLGVQAPHAPTADISWNASALIGTLYVLEGSALGAKLLYRQAEELGFDAGFGARHLAALSVDVTSWRRFLEILDEADPFDMDVAAQASISAFRAAETAFESVA